MKTKKTKFGKVTLTDWGEPDYLDGAMMQFMVTYKKRGDQFSRCAAYFAEREHAVAFAEMLSGKLSAKRPNSAPDTTDSDLQQPTPTPENGSGQS